MVRLIFLLVLLPVVISTNSSTLTSETNGSVIHPEPSTEDTNQDGPQETQSVSSAPTEASIQAFMFLEAEIAKKLDLYGGGLVLIVGVIGNALSIILLRRKGMRGTTTSLYLVALGATDLVQVVVGQATRHFVRSITGTDPPIYNTWYCKFWFYIIRVANSYSNWVLAGVSMERCIAILMPLRAKTLITRRSTKIFLALTLLIIVVYYSHSLVSYLTKPTPTGTACMANLENYFVTEIRPWSDWVLEALIPGILIIICNVIIINTLLQARAKRKVALAEGQGQKSSKDQMSSLVIMLVSISIAYLVLTTPMHVNFVIAASFPGGYIFTERNEAVRRLIWAISLFMHYTNHSINFLLYVLTGRDFRAELKLLIQELLFCRKGAEAGKGPSLKGGSMRDTKSTSLQSNSTNSANPHSTDAKSTANPHSTDAKSTANPHSTDAKSTSNPHSTDAKSTANPHSTEAKSTANPHSTEAKSTTTLQSTVS